jgi:hypothetical protein
MSAAQVQKLEALLQRVQHNRTLPHAAPGPVVTAVGVPAPAPMAVAAPTPVAAAAPAPQRPMPAAAAPQAPAAQARPARDRHATPLEMAVEGELNRPTAPQPEPMAARPKSVVQEPRRAPAVEVGRVPHPLAPTPQPMPRVQPAAQPAARQPVQAATAPSRIDSTSIAPPSKPIANVVSKHPSADPPTFGQLLSRSLRLRPR